MAEEKGSPYLLFYRLEGFVNEEPEKVEEEKEKPEEPAEANHVPGWKDLINYQENSIENDGGEKEEIFEKVEKEKFDKLVKEIEAKVEDLKGEEEKYNKDLIDAKTKHDVEDKEKKEQTSEYKVDEETKREREDEIYVIRKKMHEV
jgi:hypothetical protein